MTQRILARAMSLALAGTGLLFFASPATAAPAPEGSYQQSCRNISATGGTLSAECRKRGGSWSKTELKAYRDCSDDIANDNGDLVCDTDDEEDNAGQNERRTDSKEDSGSGNDRDMHAQSGDRGRRGTGNSDRDRGQFNDNDRGRDAEVIYPSGSYRATCRNMHIMSGDLIAECRTWDGEWHRATLHDYTRCSTDIANAEGRLVCRGGSAPPSRNTDNTQTRGDDESWGRITLFENSRYRGRRQAYGRNAASLGTMARRASSASVSGGSWQLCTRPNFKGRCVTISDSVRDFVDIGLNDRVESVRRLR